MEAYVAAIELSMLRGVRMNGGYMAWKESDAIGKDARFFCLHNLFISEREIVFEKEKADTTMINMRETQLFYSRKCDFHKVSST